jgi:membrane associated rhomboid family serine protease
MFIWDVFWFGILGAIFEKNLGRKQWILFYLGACIVSTASTLAFDGDTGIGASGIFCAFFAFGWTARKHIAAFEKTLTKPLAAFLTELELVMPLTFGVWHTAIFAPERS